MLSIDRFNNMQIYEGDTDYLIIEIKNYELNTLDCITLNVGNVIKKTYTPVTKNKFLIPFLSTDTKNKSGVYDYQIVFSSNRKSINTVIHSAKFTIIKTVGGY